MAHTVVGYFDSASEAQQAVQQLLSSGFSRENVDSTSGNNYSGSTSENSSYTDNDNDGRGSGIGRFFKSLFGDSDDADRYSNLAQRGGSIVTVYAQSSEEAERAADLLDDYGAVNVNERAAQNGYNSGNERTTDLDQNRNLDQNVNRERLDQDVNNERSNTIPKIKEELEIGKKTVETGGVRVRSRIVETPVEERIRLREEHINVERNTVDRPVSENELNSFKEGEIELTERSEVPVVNKQARVVEEVKISKDITERNETINDTVRSTEIDIDNIEGSDKRQNFTEDDDNRSSRNF
jgi:uncharacterized protein (TIGR02271 family)